MHGDMPGKPESKRQMTKGRSWKSLFQERNIPRKSSGIKEWTDAETSALVQYICLFWDDAGFGKWPIQSDPKFWDGC